MSIAIRVIFWICFGVTLYTYAGYPILIVAWASLAQVWADLRYALGRSERRVQPPSSFPSVSLLFSAHNEGLVIEAKMRNCAALEYPADRIEVLVGCDGCTDDTAGRARAANLPNGRILEYSERSGKPDVLNRLASESHGEVLVFSDANTMLDPQAVMHLARRFADPSIGCVCGDLRLITSTGGAPLEPWYWQYEVFLKFLESRLDLLLGANGGIYAVRHALFSPIPPEGIIDDFLVAMRVRSAGHRVVFDAEAFAVEEAAPRVRDEFQRRVRIGAGNFHSLRLTAPMLLPGAGRVAFSYWSHKVLRWLVPVLLPVAFLAAMVLAVEPFYRAVAAAGVGLLFAGAVGGLLARRGRHWLPVSLPFYFLSMNLALLLGLVRFLGTKPTAVWQPTGRNAPLD